MHIYSDIQSSVTLYQIIIHHKQISHREAPSIKLFEKISSKHRILVIFYVYVDLENFVCDQMNLTLRRDERLKSRVKRA